MNLRTSSNFSLRHRTLVVRVDTFIGGHLFLNGFHYCSHAFVRCFSVGVIARERRCTHTFTRFVGIGPFAQTVFHAGTLVSLFAINALTVG
ncbi:Uncharacterised protein [Burkholderia pseudomallei]|nr:Uncharacterised protein [Burkholderia pseudomallei]CAJ8167748.1 Uncharacterised protein [Burkholderia pseudomallei]CAJ9571812.1 Uncharacterised protein [Burkholderia pseudomallei]VCQ90397.1 Uncharacterised protein [Burkholderia pseudomallei]